MRHSNKERDNVAESRPGSNTGCDNTHTEEDLSNVWCHVSLHSTAEVVWSSPSSLVSCREPMLRCLHDIFRWYFGMFCCRL